MRVVGIDLGTTNSVIAFVDESGAAHAIADQKGRRILPSAVWFPATENNRVEVGETAKRRRKMNPTEVAVLFKRGMGKETFLPRGERFSSHGREWRPEELSSIIIKRLVEVAEEHLAEKVTDVVVTVPAYFGEPERAATRLAGELAGMTVHLLPAEPMAAAVAHGLDANTAAGTVLVFDLGGGTFDVTILRKMETGELQAITHNGDRELGGADFDKLIVDDITAQAASELGVDLRSDRNDEAEAWAIAEQIKIDLSERDEVDTTLVIGGKRMLYSLRKVRFEELLANYIESTELAVESALDTAGMGPSDIDTVLMVGGSSRIPAFQSMLEKYFSKKPVYSKNLDEDVARGAALMGVMRTGTAPRGSVLASLPTPKDVSSHPIGVTVVDDRGDPYNEVVLEANAPIPSVHPAEQMFGTMRDGQTQVELTVNEGGERDLRFVAPIGNAIADLGGPKPKGYPIKIRMSMTGDGILTATAHDGTDDRQIAVVRVDRKGALSSTQIAAAAQVVDDIVVI
jgi:molecular chaperone DnaK